MAINAKVSIRIKFYSHMKLAAAVAALKPEIKSSVTHRSNVSLQVFDCFLILTIDAEDAVALRAAVNAYLRWIASTINVVETIEQI
jgi:tRNA threonylcarbamoyladenosine modification (KEOPS) complex  Pcc1 subunit